MTLALVVAVAMATHDDPASASRPPDEMAAAAAAPLELLSMRETRVGDTLTVSGLVRGPDTGWDLGPLTAVVFAFDRDDALISSGRAALDTSARGPGEASRFVVRIPAAATVERYRVTFRTDRGVVGHVDRRARSPKRTDAHPM